MMEQIIIDLFIIHYQKYPSSDIYLMHRNAVITEDPEDGGIIVSCPAFPDITLKRDQRGCF